MVIILFVSSVILFWIYTIYLKIGVADLRVAAMKNDMSKMNFLLYTGIDVNRRESWGFYLQYSGETPLTGALRSANVNTISRLIEAGAKVNHVDGKGKYPVCVAASRGDVEIIRLLAKHGANYDVNYDITSPLQIAKKAGHLEAVAEIQKWLDVNRLAP